MKKILVLLFLSQSFFAQKTYEFDYAFGLETNNIVLNKNHKSIVLINSIKNDYRCYLIDDDADSTNYILNFLHIDNLHSITKAKKTDVNIAETINIPCNGYHKNSNLYKFETKNYEFKNLKDTVLNDTSYYHYVIKSTKKLKYQKRKKIQSLHFIVDKSSSSFVPFLTNSIHFEEWKKEGNVPNGKLKMLIYKDYEDKITSIGIAKNYTKIEKKIVVSKDCN